MGLEPAGIERDPHLISGRRRPFRLHVPLALELLLLDIWPVVHAVAHIGTRGVERAADLVRQRELACLGLGGEDERRVSSLLQSMTEITDVRLRSAAHEKTAIGDQDAHYDFAQL